MVGVIGNVGLSHIQDGVDLFFADGRKITEKLLNRVSAL